MPGCLLRGTILSVSGFMSVVESVCLCFSSPTNVVIILTDVCLIALCQISYSCTMASRPYWQEGLIQHASHFQPIQHASHDITDLLHVNTLR